MGSELGEVGWWGQVTFTTAQLGNGLLAPKAFQNYADLFLGGELAAGLALDFADDFFGVSVLGHGTLP